MQIKNLIIGLAIIFLTFLVVFTGIQTFYSSPEWDDFCGDISPRAPKLVEGERACTQDAQECPDGTFVSRNPNNNCEFYPCQDEFKQCNDNFDKVRETYTKTLFIITLIIGIILLLIGAKLFDLEAVGAGIMGGGIITLIYGSGAYWQYAGDVLRFIISIIGLIAVIYLAYWINNNKVKRKKKK